MRRELVACALAEKSANRREDKLGFFWLLVLRGKATRKLRSTLRSYAIMVSSAYGYCRPTYSRLARPIIIAST